MDHHAEEEQRQRAEENASTILKLQEISNISCYWNSMSEMFIPTSVYESSVDLPYGVFEVLEASIILEMMKDIMGGGDMETDDIEEVEKPKPKAKKPKAAPPAKKVSHPQP